MDYEGERNYCLQLIYALECLVDILDNNPAEYSLLITDVVCLLEGRVVTINGKRYMVNGLRQQVDELYMTFEALDLEVCYEGSGDEAEVQDMQ